MIALQNSKTRTGSAGQLRSSEQIDVRTNYPTTTNDLFQAIDTKSVGRRNLIRLLRSSPHLLGGEEENVRRTHHGRQEPIELKETQNQPKPPYDGAIDILYNDDEFVFNEAPKVSPSEFNVRQINKITPSRSKKPYLQEGDQVLKFGSTFALLPAR